MRSRYFLLILVVSVIASVPSSIHACSLVPPRPGYGYHFGVTMTILDYSQNTLNETNFDGSLGADCSVTVNYQVTDPVTSSLYIGDTLYEITDGQPNPVNNTTLGLYEYNYNDKYWSLQDIAGSEMYYTHYSTPNQILIRNQSNDTQTIVEIPWSNYTATLFNNSESIEFYGNEQIVAGATSSVHVIATNSTTTNLLNYNMTTKAFSSLSLNEFSGEIADYVLDRSTDYSHLIAVAELSSNNTIQFIKINLTEETVASYNYDDKYHFSMWKAKTQLDLYDNTLYISQRDNITTYDFDTGQTDLIDFETQSIVTLPDYLLIFNGETTQTRTGTAIAGFTWWAAVPVLVAIPILSRIHHNKD